MLFHTNSIIYILAQEDDIETQFGVVHVVVQGQQRSASTPAILTFHDIGLTSTLMFCRFSAYYSLFCCLAWLSMHDQMQLV